MQIDFRNAHVSRHRSKWHLSAITLSFSKGVFQTTLGFVSEIIQGLYTLHCKHSPWHEFQQQSIKQQLTTAEVSPARNPQESLFCSTGRDLFFLYTHISKGALYAALEAVLESREKTEKDFKSQNHRYFFNPGDVTTLHTTARFWSSQRNIYRDLLACLPLTITPGTLTSPE